MFLAGRDITSDSSEKLGSFGRSETPGDLPVNLGHPQVPLRRKLRGNSLSWPLSGERRLKKNLLKQL